MSGAASKRAKRYLLLASRHDQDAEYYLAMAEEANSASIEKAYRACAEYFRDKAAFYRQRSAEAANAASTERAYRACAEYFRDKAAFYLQRSAEEAKRIGESS